MVEAERDWRGICVKQVQLTDLESGDFVPPGHDIVGSQVGNHIWRSPEAHLKGRVNKPSDMFSFGIVVSVPNNTLPSPG